MWSLCSALFNTWPLGSLNISILPTRRAKENEGIWMGGCIDLVCKWRYDTCSHPTVENRASQLRGVLKNVLPKDRTNLRAISDICTVSNTWDILASHLPFFFVLFLSWFRIFAKKCTIWESLQRLQQKLFWQWTNINDMSIFSQRYLLEWRRRVGESLRKREVESISVQWSLYKSHEVTLTVRPHSLSP